MGTATREMIGGSEPPSVFKPQSPKHLLTRTPSIDSTDSEYGLLF